MTLGLSKDIQCHVCRQTSGLSKWVISLAVADGQFNLPPGFVPILS